MVSWWVKSAAPRTRRRVDKVSRQLCHMVNSGNVMACLQAGLDPWEGSRGSDIRIPLIGHRSRCTNGGHFTMHEGFSMVFNEEQKTLQDLAGRVPAPLSAMTGIHLDNAMHEPQGAGGAEACHGLTNVIHTKPTQNSNLPPRRRTRR